MSPYDEHRDEYYANMPGWRKPNDVSKALMQAALESEDGTDERLGFLSKLAQDMGVSLCRLIETRCPRTVYQDRRTEYNSQGDRDWTMAFRCLEQAGLMEITKRRGEHETFLTAKFMPGADNVGSNSGSG